MEWFALLIPLLGIVISVYFFSRKLVWWELLLPIAIIFIVIVTCRGCGIYLQTKDTEYWGGWIDHAVYFEPWDERVSCSHAKYHTDEDGDMVFDGYEHIYDVDNHYAYYQIEDSNGFRYLIDESEFQRLCSLFESRSFVEMNRDYHSQDGDAYVAHWNEEWKTLQPVTTKQPYENKVAASRGLYKYRTINPKKSPVFEYPEIDRYVVSSVVSKTSWKGSEEIDKVNAALGASKQVRVWVIIWEGHIPLSVALDQEAYWKGGNKNEIVVCVNVNNHKDPTVNWCHVFSWSKSEQLKAETVSFVSNSKLDLTSLSSFLYERIKVGWKRRDWSEFDYLSIELPTTSVVLIWILSVALTFGLCAFAVINDFDAGIEND